MEETCAGILVWDSMVSAGFSCGFVRSILTRFISPIVAMTAAVIKYSFRIPALLAAQCAEIRRNGCNLLVGQLALPSRHDCALPAVGDGLDHIRVGETGLGLGAGKIGRTDHGVALAVAAVATRAASFEHSAAIGGNQSDPKQENDHYSRLHTCSSL